MNISFSLSILSTVTGWQLKNCLEDLWYVWFVNLTPTLIYSILCSAALWYIVVNTICSIISDCSKFTFEAGKNEIGLVSIRVQWFWLFFTFWGITTYPWHPKGPRIWKLAKKNVQLHPWPAEIFGKNRKMRFLGLVSKFNFRSPVWQIFTIFFSMFYLWNP